MKDTNKLLNEYGVICTPKDKKSFCEYFLGGGADIAVVLLKGHVPGVHFIAQYQAKK